MTQHYPTRHFQRYNLRDVITDTIRGTDGREHLVSMRGWHWNNLGWIKRNTHVTEEILVDNAVISLVADQQVSVHERDYKGEITLSLTMESTIYHFINAYHNAKTGNTAKDISGEKGTIGRA